MSRHSKWSKVKQFKGAIDAKRSASFTKLAREITIAAREKGGDASFNPRLRTAIERARNGSMPKENIERAIARGIGGGDAGEIATLTYEAYAPGGTAIVIESLTDNRNRAVGEIKHLLSEHDASLATNGSVTYLFDHVGVVRLSVGSLPANAELAFIEAGASDIIVDGESIELRMPPNHLASVSDATARFGFTAETIALEWIPKMLVDTDEVVATHIMELIDELEAHDDVSRVFSNLA